MFNDLLKKLLSMDDIVILRYIDTVYPVGLGIICINFILSFGENLFCGDLFEIVKDLIFTAFLFIAWRVICEILYCVAPDDKK